MPVLNKHLARWYRETAQHLRAGIPLPRAWEMAGGVPKRERLRLSGRLLTGEPVGTVLANGPRWMPAIDRRVLTAAAQSGQLPETLLVLSEQRAVAGRQTVRAVSASLYPLFLVHFAAVVLPLHVWVSQDLEAYLRKVIPALLPLWAVLAVLTWATLRRHRWLAFLMGLLPLFRSSMKSRSLANLTFALHASLVAGETVSVAWQGAGKATNNRRLRRLAGKTAEQAQLGTPPGTTIQNFRVLPEDFISLYQTGEQTGQLTDNLKYIWDLYSERAVEKLQSAVFWYTKLLLLLVVFGLAIVIIRAYVAQFDRLLEYGM